MSAFLSAEVTGVAVLLAMTGFLSIAAYVLVQIRAARLKRVAVQPAAARSADRRREGAGVGSGIGYE